MSIFLLTIGHCSKNTVSFTSGYGCAISSGKRQQERMVKVFSGKYQWCDPGKFLKNQRSDSLIGSSIGNSTSITKRVAMSPRTIPTTRVGLEMIIVIPTAQANTSQYQRAQMREMVFPRGLFWAGISGSLNSRTFFGIRPHPLEWLTPAGKTGGDGIFCSE